MKQISFTLDDGQTEDFYIEEQTVIAGRSYLLVSDSPGEEAQVFILRDVSSGTEGEACYEMVEDEEELEAVFRVFQELLEDEDTILTQS